MCGGADKIKVMWKIKGTGVQPGVVDFNELWHFYYHY